MLAEGHGLCHWIQCIENSLWRMTGEAERHTERCSLHCFPAVAEWFYCMIDLTDHLISSLMYQSRQSTGSLSVWESDFKVPSTIQEMVLQTFLYLLMEGLIAGCGMKQLKRHHWGWPVREWQSAYKDCYTASCTENGWFDKELLVVVLYRKKRVLFSVSAA